ncbi:hypothetical protein [Ensifer sp. SL37]|uniref:hypothetical protein n=1 Tax=Ensifer sp. SL37 TaxID=2995137 RepID=UPI002DD41D02|nr:hypothetical protein [Ensifer sp. SL37]
MRWLLTLAVVVLLTLLTQIGGAVWIVTLGLLRRRRAGVAVFLALFLGLYAAGTALSYAIAPIFGRVPLPCFDDGTSRLKMQSPLFCVLNRQYVVPELKEAAAALSRHVDQVFPGTTTLALDANFPFFDGFPLFRICPIRTVGSSMSRSSIRMPRAIMRIRRPARRSAILPSSSRDRTAFSHAGIAKTS